MADITVKFLRKKDPRKFDIVWDLFDESADRAVNFIDKADAGIECQSRLMTFYAQFFRHNLKRLEAGESGERLRDEEMTAGYIISAFVNYAHKTGKDISGPWLMHMESLISMSGPAGSA